MPKIPKASERIKFLDNLAIFLRYLKFFFNLTHDLGFFGNIREVGAPVSVVNLCRESIKYGTQSATTVL